MVRPLFLLLVCVTFLGCLLTDFADGAFEAGRLDKGKGKAVDEDDLFGPVKETAAGKLHCWTYLFVVRMLI